MSKKNKFYVYVYLNPLKSGKYSYMENSIGIDFDCEPFYIGEGQNSRMISHLREAKRCKTQKINNHKINTIKKILKNNLEPIIYKIFEFENEQDALNVERTLGFLIGRYNINEGPLTNQVDCGQRTTRPSKEIINKIQIKRSNTLKIDPEIMKEAGRKASITIKNKSDEEKEMIYNKRRKTFQDNPEIETNRVLKLKQTLRDNPEINLNKGFKISKIKIDRVEEEIKLTADKRRNTIQQEPWRINKVRESCRNPEYNKKRSESLKNTYKNNPDLKINNGKKISESLLKNGSCRGINNPNYIKLNHIFLIKLYFINLDFQDIIFLYYKKFNFQLSRHSLVQFFKILNFPINTSSFISKKKNRIYLKFINDNKYKIQEYINNYEKLEQEYFMINKKGRK